MSIVGANAQWNLNHELRSSARALALGPYSTPMQLDQTSHHRKTDAEPQGGVSILSLLLVKQVKYLIEFVDLDTHPVVGDGDLRILRAAGQCDFYGAPFRRVLDRVAKQVV